MTVRTNKLLHNYSYGQILSLVCTLKYHLTLLMNNLGLKIVSVKMVCYCIFMLLSSKAWITLSGNDLIIAHCV